MPANKNVLEEVLDELADTVMGKVVQTTLGKVGQVPTPPGRSVPQDPSYSTTLWPAAPVQAPVTSDEAYGPGGVPNPGYPAAPVTLDPAYTPQPGAAPAPAMGPTTTPVSDAQANALAADMSRAPAYAGMPAGTPAPQTRSLDEIAAAMGYTGSAPVQAKGSSTDPVWASGTVPVIPGYGESHERLTGNAGQRELVNELATVLTAPKLGTDDAKAQGIYDAMLAAHPERAADAATSLETANDAVLTARTTRENPSRQRYGPGGDKFMSDLLSNPDVADEAAGGRALSAAKGLSPADGLRLAGQYKRAAQEAANQKLVAAGDTKGPDAFSDWGQAFKYAQLKGQDFGAAYRFANDWRKQKYGDDVAASMTRTAAPGPQEAAENKVRAVLAKMQGQGQGPATKSQAAPTKPAKPSRLDLVKEGQALENDYKRVATEAAKATTDDARRKIATSIAATADKLQSFIAVAQADPSNKTVAKMLPNKLAQLDTLRKNYGKDLADVETIIQYLQAEPAPEDESKRVVGKFYRRADGTVSRWKGK